MDIDNLIGGAKGIIDILRSLGLLLDDDDGGLELAAMNVSLEPGESPHTVLVLEECP